MNGEDEVVAARTRRHGQHERGEEQDEGSGVLRSDLGVERWRRRAGKATGEIRIAAISVPRMNAPTPETPSSSKSP